FPRGADGQRCAVTHARSRAMRLTLTVSRLLIAALPLAPLGAQQSPRLTEADYARAERFLGANTIPLVSGIAGRPVWLEDGRFWYRVTTADGAAFHIVNPARRTRQEVF